jgi:hypothetical protein
MDVKSVMPWVNVLGDPHEDWWMFTVVQRNEFAPFSGSKNSSSK